MPQQRITTGTRKLNTDGSWTAFEAERTKAGNGNILFQPDDLGGAGVLSVRIRDVRTGGVTADVHWCRGDLSRKVLVPDVGNGVVFTMQLRGANGSSVFGGTLTW
ncbi:MAG: hypothetical protein ACT4RN_00680 [Pseudonocardia sp.]